MIMFHPLAAALLLLPPLPRARADGAPADRLRPIDVFQLEYASDPQISPDGTKVVYVRNFMDVMKDRKRSNLWIINTDGSDHRPLTTGKNNDHSPRWSADGKRLAYIADDGASHKLCVRWLDTAQMAILVDAVVPLGNPSWSPDGKRIAFNQFVPERVKPFVEMPPKPEGAEWAEPFKVIRAVHYRQDGEGYRKGGYHQLFVIPADGGAPRQLTDGPYDQRSPPVWTPDGEAILFAANRHPEGDLDPLNTEVYELILANRSVKALTDRKGPDEEPALAPQGNTIAYVGFDDERKGYQERRLSIISRDGAQKPWRIARTIDREMHHPVWDKEGTGVFFQYDDRGTTRIAFAPILGEVQEIAADVGGVTLGRPYASGSFSVGGEDVVAFTQTRPDRPADVAVYRNKAVKRLTSLNEGLLGARTLGAVEEIWFESSHDKRKIQGWIVKPPHFDPKKKYPLILEIHGGPYANYGARFTAEIQLYAAAGYVVLYTNPRGSTGYGEEFARLIDHNYPSQDYDDLMSGVDAVIKRGYVDEDNLFVTGGSGGGVLTAWIVGKTKRFRAAVSCKPVINWYSHALTADIYPFFTQYWFSGPPWERTEEYMKRSPIALVGNVKTPTMVLTGEVDHRTPISESEQFYQALKLREVETALVRVPGASHDIGARPSQTIALVLHVLKWFEIHKK
jgi:acylaminoacyl-peptidase